MWIDSRVCDDDGNGIINSLGDTQVEIGPKHLSVNYDFHVDLAAKADLKMLTPALEMPVVGDPVAHAASLNPGKCQPLFFVEINIKLRFRKRNHSP